MAMTSRERVLAALRRETPDMVPLDLGGTESSGISGIAYNRLRDFLGLGPDGTRIFDVYQQIAVVGDDVREALGIDTIPLLMEPLEWKPFALPDGSPCSIPEGWNPERDSADGWIVKDDDGGVIARMPSGSFYFEPVGPPLAGIQSPSELASFADAIETFDWPSFADESIESIASRAVRLHESTDYAVVANLQLHLLAAGQILRGYEAFMMDLMLDKSLAGALLDMLTDAYVRRCDRYFERMRGYVDVVLVNDDLGTQHGPMLSPALYREMIHPRQKRLFRHIHETSGAFVLFHSCGSVHTFIPDLAEAGVDALNPVQVSADGMDTNRLKRDYGDIMTFWGGGCDTQRVLCSGSKLEIRDEVRRRIGDLAPDGGFVFTQVHNIQPDVPPENIMAMYEAFYENRRY